MGDEIPLGTVGGNVVGRQVGARGNGGPRGEALEAVAVKGTNSRPAVRGSSGDAYVAELRVVAALDGSPRDDQTCSDTGAHGDVGEIGKAASGSPAAFGQRSGVDIRIDSGRNAALPSEPLEHAGTLPPGFHARDDVAEGRGAR